MVNIRMSCSQSSDEEEVDHHKLKTPGEQLLAAAVNGDEEFLKKLLDENQSLINYKDEDGYTVLHRVCYSSKENILQLCLGYLKGEERTKLVNSTTDDGWTPLHSASKWNAFKCVQILLANEADVNVQSEGGNTPLHMASDRGDARETMTLLLLHPKLNPDVVNQAGETAFDITKRRGKLSCLFELVRKSINHI